MALGGDQECWTGTFISSIFICTYKNKHKQQKQADNTLLHQRNLQLFPSVLNYMSTDVKMCMAKKKCQRPSRHPAIPSCSCCVTTAALTSSNGIRRLKSPGAPRPIAGEKQNCNAAFLLLAAAPSSTLWCMSAAIRFPAADSNSLPSPSHWHTR